MFFKFISKYWFYLVGGLVVLIVLLKYIKNLFTKKSDVLDVETSNIQDTTTIISNDVAQNLATQLMVAIDRTGTDEKAIQEVYTKIGGNISRLKQIYNFFGMPYYSTAWGVIQQPLFATFLGFGTARRNLRDILKFELSANDFEKWDKLFLLAGIA